MRAPSPRWFITILCLALVLPACRKKEASLSTEKESTKKDTRKTVVRVFSTIQNVDAYEPWKPGSTVSLEGCGTILPGGKVLTVSNLAEKANYIEVQKFGETKRYVAKVDKIGWDLDLALLTVDDKDFPQGADPVEFGTLPQPGDKVEVQGPDELTMKEDTISGLDMVWVWEGATYVPALMTNGEIDPKLNGCPLFKDGKFVGTPFSNWHKQEKSGAIAPVNVVQRFLRAVEGSKDYQPLADLGVYSQDLKSSDLRDYYHLPADKTGVVITQVLYQSAGDGLLKEGDVITAIDGHAVDNEGYIQLDKNERVAGDYLITFYLPGESTELDIVRQGQPLKVKVPLKPLPKLVPYYVDQRSPTYFMIAGFVFSPLTYNYLQSVDFNALKPETKDLYLHGLVTPQRREVVLLTHVLRSDINEGYHYFNNIVVDKVNGRPIRDMRDLVEAFQHPKGDKHVIEFDDHAWTGSRVVFDAKKTQKATQELMKSLDMSFDRSEDLRPLEAESTTAPGAETKGAGKTPTEIPTH